VAQVAIKNLWMNKNIKDSIDDRRLHDQLYPEYTEIEIGFDSEVEQTLKEYGHSFKCFNYGGSVVKVIKNSVHIKLIL
jgi:gamma-glutamyltranspeptidase